MCSNALPIVELVDLVDRQLQLARFGGRPDVLADLVEDVVDLRDGAGAEGDADIGDAARGMQVEIEFGAGAAETANIDDAALTLVAASFWLATAAGRLGRSEYHDLFGRSCPEVY
jgi:hypothetical protein